ncbi:hypothetical protein LY90DRAFT_512098, partial [Neocallimastix californiae]
MIRFFIYISIIPKWIYWMTRNLFFVDLWKNPFLYYNKSFFKYNEDVDEAYLSEMSYSQRKNLLNNDNCTETLNNEKLSNVQNMNNEMLHDMHNINDEKLDNEQNINNEKSDNEQNETIGIEQ